VLRPLSADERERAMGFPPGASGSSPLASPGGFTQEEFHRCAALGNAFSVFAMVIVAAQLSEACRGATPAMREGHPSALSAQEALRSLGASSDQPLNSSRR
jgi:hypothetical protein